jgi:hypothetical protein
MPRDGGIIFRDLVGRTDYLEVVCEKCGTSGRYRVDRLVERYGIDNKLFDWTDDITRDCARKIAGNYDDQCGCRCPTLVELFYPR